MADFAITNSQYGRTGSIFRCKHCGFHQCSELHKVLQHYVGMVDDVYENTRSARSLQERAILHAISKLQPSGDLLDVGAGSGILVEEAIKLGYSAVGVEPSKFLCEKAHFRNLPVVQGVLPHSSISGSYDVITMIDVIEHVPDPIRVLTECRRVLRKGGILVIVTPDRGSICAKILGWKWWHYRIAHIGYFDNKTLKTALEKANLQILRAKRPSWYFPADYLFERVCSFLPRRLRIKSPKWLRHVIVPLNLRDSLMIFCGSDHK